MKKYNDTSDVFQGISVLLSCLVRLGSVFLLLI